MQKTYLGTKKPKHTLFIFTFFNSLTPSKLKIINLAFYLFFSLSPVLTSLQFNLSDQTILLYFLREKLQRCNVRIQNKNKIQIYI